MSLASDGLGHPAWCPEPGQRWDKFSHSLRLGRPNCVLRLERNRTLCLCLLGRTLGSLHRLLLGLGLLRGLLGFLSRLLGRLPGRKLDRLLGRNRCCIRRGLLQERL